MDTLAGLWGLFHLLPHCMASFSFLLSAEFHLPPTPPQHKGRNSTEQCLQPVPDLQTSFQPARLALSPRETACKGTAKLLRNKDYKNTSVEFWRQETLLYQTGANFLSTDPNPKAYMYFRCVWRGQSVCALGWNGFICQSIYLNHFLELY